MPFDRGLQRLIGAALIDDNVLAALLEDPLSLADRFGLTTPERRFVVGVHARDLEHFAALVERWSADWLLIEHQLINPCELTQLAG